MPNPFGQVGRALGGAVKAPARQMYSPKRPVQTGAQSYAKGMAMKQPQMGAGIGPSGGALGAVRNQMQQPNQRGGAIGGLMNRAQPMMQSRQEMQQPPAMAANFGRPAPQGNFQLNPGVNAANTFGGANLRAMNPGMQNAMQQAGNAIGGAFGRGRGIGPMRSPMPSLPDGRDPNSGVAPEMPPPEENTPEMMAMKNLQMQQQEATRPDMGMRRPMMGGAMGGMMNRFGGGAMGGLMNRMQQQPPPMEQPAPEQEGPMSMPDQAMDEMRRNKFAQMRQGGIGPRFGMGPMQY